MEDLETSNTEDELSFMQRRALRHKKGKKPRRRSKRLAALKLIDDFDEPNLPEITKPAESIPLIQHEEEEKYDFLESTNTNHQDQKQQQQSMITELEEIKEEIPNPPHDAMNEINQKHNESKQLLEEQRNQRNEINAVQECKENKENPIDVTNDKQKEENAQTESERSISKPTKFPVISSINELDIDPSDIMDPVELLKRRVDDMFAENRAMESKDDSIGGVHDNTNSKGLQCSESYLETKSSKFVRLLSQKNISGAMEGDEYMMYNSNLIADGNVMYTLQNEMMSVFTWIVGIVEGVGLLTLFVALNNDDAHFVQQFASSLYIIQFLSYILGAILIPFCFILLNHQSDTKVISVYHKGLFICCSIGIFICGMIEFPISDEIYFEYERDHEYFTVQSNVDRMASKVSQWRKVHIAQFCLLSIVWILCISFMHRSKKIDESEQKKNE